MQIDNFIITIFADDRPGIIQTLSDVILEHDASWQESSLTRLCGQFAGIVSLTIADDKQAALVTSLQALQEQGIEVTVQTAKPSQGHVRGEVIELMVEANDRPGIVDEIASVLAKIEVNVEQLETVCQSASMAGYNLFTAHLVVALPDSLDVEGLEAALESISDDVMLSILESFA